MEAVAPPEVWEFEQETKRETIEEASRQGKAGRLPYLFPIPVKEYAREALLQAFPALEESPDAWEYLRLAEYLLFSTFREDNGNIIVPHEVVAERVGKSTGSQGFSADAWLKQFSEKVWPLKVTPYNFSKGLARTVVPEWPQEVHDFLSTAPRELDEDGMLYMVTGKPVTKKSHQRMLSKLEKQLLEQANGSVKNPRIARLVSYLNTRSSTVQKKIVKKNWACVMAMLDQMPTNSEREQRQKSYVAAALIQLTSFNQNIYEGKKKTARIYTIGPSFHSLPREFRKALLAGCTHLDAKSIQLAIVAKLWNLPKMQEFLFNPHSPSIWQKLYDDVAPHLNFNDAKLAFKRTIYSLVFGMDEPSLRFYLRYGDWTKHIPGLGCEQAVKRFFDHPLIQEALIQREVRLTAIKNEGFITDKFGVRRDYIADETDEKSLLAAEVQSWEVHLMLSLVDVFEAEDSLHLVSFLHDGITVHFSDPAKEKKLVDKLQTAFNNAARSEGINTTLELEN